jgi:DNA adenine methylase
MNYSCKICQKTFTQKSLYEHHLKRKIPCISEEAKYIESIKGTNGYKRISLSPLRYAGGKSKAIGLILENFPKLKNKKVVSPFFGGGSFEITLSSKLGYEVIGYDIFNILVNFWQVLIKDPKKLSEELKKLKPTSEDFTRNRHILLNHWEKVKPKDLVYKTKKVVQLTDAEKTMLDDSLLLATYYYYNMQLSYGPMFLGWQSSVYLKDKRYKSITDTIEKFNPGNLSVHCSSFEDVIQKHSEDFLFLDPPYYLGEDSKMFKGIYPNSNFAIHHKSFDHKLLSELLKKHKGGFFMTYNDCPAIREMYKDYEQKFPKWQYTYGQGETRIGKNREGKDNTKESHEIFIICQPST